MNTDWLRHVTPMNVVKWATVIFVVCFQALVIIALVLSMIEGFS